MITATKPKIRVLVVDDSVFQQDVITDILQSDPEIEVIGCAGDGVEAIEQTLKLRPDVITMDIKMPKMDGLDATREIMAKRPTPIVVVSTIIQKQEEFALNCLERGALDFVPLSGQTDVLADELLSKVKVCSRIKVVTHPRARKLSSSQSSVGKKGYQIIGIAVSTGGPVALKAVLSKLPSQFPAPVVIVQHIPEGFTKSLAEWLSGQSRISIAEANDGEALEPGRVYLAPSGHHLIVDREKKIRLLDKEFDRYYHKPSGDIMLKSIAEVYGHKAIGIILTGMGKDGAEGIKAIREVGGFTLAQDRSTSIIYGMNKTAIEEGSVKEIVPLDQIAKKLMTLMKS
jgi:two-component system chemotaxis response regulator CheB